MNLASPSRPTAPVSKSRRVKILIIFVVALGGLLAWEFLALGNHRASLARLQQAMERGRIVNTVLRREDIAAFLVGSPTKQSEPRTLIEPGKFKHVDYYTW